MPIYDDIWRQQDRLTPNQGHTVSLTYWSIENTICRYFMDIDVWSYIINALTLVFILCSIDEDDNIFTAL